MQVEPDELRASYEALRKQILEGKTSTTRPLGLAVLIQKGMPAWINSHEQTAPKKRRKNTTSKLSEMLEIHSEINAGLVKVLANMTLTAQ